MKKAALILLTIGFLLGSLLTAQGVGDYQIIVNKANPTSSMSKDKVSRMFLKKISKWENGISVLPVDQISSSSVRRSFSKTVHGKSVSAIKNYWQQQVFSGRGTPPPEKASDAQVLIYVRANPGAIGYVSGNASVGNVKVLRVSR